jgi:hypothetical protein
MLEDPEYQEMTEMNHNGVREKRDCEERTVGGVKRTTCRRVRREADAKNAVLEDVKDVDRCVGGKQSTGRARKSARRRAHGGEHGDKEHGGAKHGAKGEAKRK